MQQLEERSPGLARLRPGQPAASLEIEAAWLVDPLSGRQGPAGLTLRDGVLADVDWLPDEQRAGWRESELLVLPGLLELSGWTEGEEQAGAHGGFTRLLSADEQDAAGVVCVHRPLSAGEGEAAAGVAATVLGLQPVTAASEVEAVTEALHQLREQAAESGPADAPPLHLAHLSTSAAIELVAEARATGLPVSCDVAVHQIALHDGWLGGDRRFSWQAVASPWSGGPAEAAAYHPATRVDPPLVSPAQAVALGQAVAAGAVQVISSAHLPRARHELDVPYGEVPPGISGLETCLSLVVLAAEAGVLPLLAAVRALTTGPAAIAQLPSYGLSPGQPADLVLFDRRASWSVDDASLVSRGLNTPLLGRALPGRVLLTLSAGRVSWLDADPTSTRDAC